MIADRRELLQAADGSTEVERRRCSTELQYHIE